MRWVFTDEGRFVKSSDVLKTVVERHGSWVREGSLGWWGRSPVRFFRGGAERAWSALRGLRGSEVQATTFVVILTSVLSSVCICGEST